MIQPGDVISYLQMCIEEGFSLQRGMNFQINGNTSVILMNLRPNAPYVDRIEDQGRTLIYEGHDVPKTQDSPIPKIIDQPLHNQGGTLTQNGLFYRAAKDYQKGIQSAALVRVYEKLHRGIWVYNGTFELIDAWQEDSNTRKVFKFKLALSEDTKIMKKISQQDIELEHNRIIPPQIKLAVWKRDKGKCTKCGSTDNLHFDHIIPFSRGGSSLVVENIQLLCARHNLEKGDKIQ